MKMNSTKLIAVAAAIRIRPKLINEKSSGTIVCNKLGEVPYNSNSTT